MNHMFTHPTVATTDLNEVRNSVQHADVMNNLDQFDASMWTLFSGFLVVLWLLLWFHYWIHRVKDGVTQSLWHIVSHLLAHDSIVSFNMVSAYISTLSAMYIFLTINCYLENMMSTDLVTVTPPKVMSNWDDLLSSDYKNARPLWFKELGYWQEWEEAYERSLRNEDLDEAEVMMAKIWKKGLEMANKPPGFTSLVRMNFDSSRQTMEEGYAGKIVMLDLGLITQTLRKSLCVMFVAPEPPYKTLWCSWYKKDPRGKKVTQGIAVSKNWTGPERDAFKKM